MNQPHFKNKLFTSFVFALPLTHRSLGRTDEERGGQISVTILFFAALTIVLVSGFVSLASSFLQLSVRSLNKARAFDIAEAGIDYYRWHLAHAPQDYQDGTGQPGPYNHNYYDTDGHYLGHFALTIVPPQVGSTMVTIRSTGNVLADPSIQKIIEVRLGIPSFAKYAWILDSGYVAFGTGAEVFGTVMSNTGIHFNGTAHNLVSSALMTSTDPDTVRTEWAVYTTRGQSDPHPPTPYPARPDVFMAGRSIGVPAVNFTGITQNLSDIKTAAIASSTYFGSSTVQGWDLHLATSGIYSVYKVAALAAIPHNCTSTSGGSSQSGWGLWSVQSSTLYATGTIPNGQMFFEDNLWVQGQINQKRFTVGAARFQGAQANITVNHDLLYTNYNGSDTISLIAQNNINVGLQSDDDLRIDGALFAQNGRVGRYSYNSHCGTTQSRAQLTTYGMLGSGLRPMFYYSTSDGYQSRDYIYDSNLLYGPPPGFPRTTDQYTPISWTEIQ